MNHLVQLSDGAFWDIEDIVAVEYMNGSWWVRRRDGPRDAIQAEYLSAVLRALVCDPDEAHLAAIQKDALNHNPQLSPERRELSEKVLHALLQEFPDEYYEHAYNEGAGYLRSLLPAIREKRLSTKPLEKIIVLLGEADSGWRAMP